MGRDEIKRTLSKLGDHPLLDIEQAWVELMLERHNGNRSATREMLKISMSKMRRYITNNKVFVKKLKTPGRPNKAKGMI